MLKNDSMGCHQPSPLRKEAIKVYVNIMSVGKWANNDDGDAWRLMKRPKGWWCAHKSLQNNEIRVRLIVNVFEKVHISYTKIEWCTLQICVTWNNIYFMIFFCTFLQKWCGTLVWVMTIVKYMCCAEWQKGRHGAPQIRKRDG